MNTGTPFVDSIVECMYTKSMKSSINLKFENKFPHFLLNFNELYKIKICRLKNMETFHLLENISKFLMLNLGFWISAPSIFVPNVKTKEYRKFVTFFLHS